MKIYSLILFLFCLSIYPSVQANQTKNWKIEAPESFESYWRWCLHAERHIHLALKQGERSNDLSKELKIYRAALERSLSETPERDYMYFLESLKEIKVGQETYRNVDGDFDLEDVVIFYRTSFRYAIDDLNEIDKKIRNGCWYENCYADRGPYIMRVLIRGFIEAHSVKRNEQELKVFNRLANYSIEQLKKSRFSRYRYSCAIELLQDAQKDESITGKRYYLRQARQIIHQNQYYQGGREHRPEDRLM
jgi:hypothetical protein